MRELELYVPPPLHVAVRFAGGNRCVACDATDSIQVDHVKPRHAGGLSIPVNLVLLCEPCNVVKSCYWPWHGYHPIPGNDDPRRAADIHLAEIDWIERRHGRAEVLGQLWGDDGEPGTWAYRRLPDGMPKWLAE